MTPEGDTMRALAKLEPREGIWRTEAPRPSIGPNDVLIRITNTSLCGTDVHIFNWDAWSQRTVPVPLITGHEYVGVIAAVGAEVSGLAPGDRVSGEGHITCGHCRNCRAGRRHLCRNTLGVGVQRQGAFADYLALPASNAFKLPASIPNEVAAILDPLGNAVHTALAFDLVGEDVLITGAGPIGLMAAAVARFVGARHIVITDVNRERLALASALGASRTVDVSDPGSDLGQVMAELGMKEGFDVGLEMSGAPAAYRQLLDTVIHGGKLALLGIPSKEFAVDFNRVIFKGLTLQGIYGRQMFETWYKMINLLEAGLDVTPVITHRFPMERYQDAFEVMRAGSSGKVILDWA
ncbi:MAG TPA: L-threonine 3-dehydrogenase [Trueperaceae bacterium]|nr:L-threonine 3-dehydrogenase [Trueperaceae bacterium]